MEHLQEKSSRRRLHPSGAMAEWNTFFLGDDDESDQFSHIARSSPTQSGSAWASKRSPYLNRVGLGQLE